MSARGIDRKETSWSQKINRLQGQIARDGVYSSSRERITDARVRLIGEALMLAGYLDTDWCDEDGPFHEVVEACLDAMWPE